MTAAPNTTVDPKEIAHFAAMAEDWWDPKGKFAPLHRMNPMRLAYVKQQICHRFDREEESLRPFAGLRILDMGCGGGLLSEPLARLGAHVTGVDATEANIDIANNHAEEMGLDIDYRLGTAEEMAAAGHSFDVVMILEIVEHVADVGAFLKACSKLLSPKGVLLFSTLNRTARSFLAAIIGAEYVLRWLPRGTHDWRRFITPEELTQQLAQAELQVTDLTGLQYQPLAANWRQSRDLSVNYIGSAVPHSA